MTTAPRQRRRVNVEADTTTETKTAQAKSLLVTIRETAAAKNAATALEKKQVQQLEKLMGELGITALEAVMGDKIVEGIVSHGSPSNVIDIAELAQKITHDQLLTVVTASVGAVKDAFGSNIANASTKEKQGEYKLRVGFKK